jgi:alpha-tubulin suppressor-like RCC1 family protein
MLAIAPLQVQAAPLQQEENPPVSTLAQADKISTGGGHTCWLYNGTISCWGKEDSGQVPPGGKQTGVFSQVSAGGNHTCGLRSNGTIFCWGSDTSGQSTLPFTQVGKLFTQVSAGGSHTCGLRDNATLVCWGNNNFGQAPTISATQKFIQVSAGENHTCALKSDGTLVCWGLASSGQSTPPEGTFRQVSAGGKHTCGLKSDSTLVCWGLNGNGQSAPPSGTFTQIDAGGRHTCGLRTSGTLACWGENSFGQSTPPAEIFTQVSAGDYHTCGLQIDGKWACWGDNTYGQVAKPTISGNAGVAGATLTYVDGKLKTVKSDATGHYVFQVSYHWTGTVTPSKPGYIFFSPPSRGYTDVLTDKPNQNYTANALAKFKSYGAYDGWILESSENSNAGGTFNAASNKFIVGDDQNNRQYRSILSFSTEALPDNAVVTSVTLRLTKAGGVGADPFNTHGLLKVDVANPYFGSQLDFELGDFAADATLTSAGGVDPTIFTAKLDKKTYPIINRTGSTQLRLRFALDDNNDHIANYLLFFSGEYATMTQRPILEILYYVPMP